MSGPHRVYFVPGMFGFGQLAGYDYFTHLRAALARRYRDAGIEVAFEDVPAPPTSSLRYRSRVLLTTIARTASLDQVSCGRHRQSGARAHVERLRPRRRSNAHRHRRELPAEGRVGRRAGSASTLRWHRPNRAAKVGRLSR